MATSEVADILTMARCVLEANIYGVKVEGETLRPEPETCSSAAFCVFINALLTETVQVTKGGSAWQLLF